MLIILEGPRNSGKTTAAKRLKAALGDTAYLIKFQRTASPPMFMTDFLAKNYLALVDSRSICILDRFHLTEFVYRSLDKKVDDEVLHTTTHMVDIMLKHMGAITYIMETSPQTRKSRYALRDESHNKPELGLPVEQIDEAWALAAKLFHRSRVKKWPGETEMDIMKLVVDAKRYANGGTKVGDRISFLAPVIKVPSIPQMEVA